MYQNSQMNIDHFSSHLHSTETPGNMCKNISEIPTVSSSLYDQRTKNGSPRTKSHSSGSMRRCKHEVMRLMNIQNLNLRAYESSYDSILFFCHWCYRKTISLLKYLHPLKSWGGAELCYGYNTRKFFDIFDIDTLPYRLLSGRLRIIVLPS